MDNCVNSYRRFLSGDKEGLAEVIRTHRDGLTLYIYSIVGNMDLAEEIIANPPMQGYLTISNALQWRLQYKRVIELDNQIQGVVNFVW